MGTKVNYAVTVVLVILVVMLGGASYYFYKEFNDLKANPQKVAQDEVSVLVAKVGKLIVLPTDETPTIATVSDPEALKDQPFFKNAKTGDRVLIYTNARKAILYSPTENKIVEVAPINIGEPTASETIQEAE